ncbi:MAG: LuxR C-terminal-related transcriptional regulator [Bacteroidota bacterium]
MRTAGFIVAIDSYLLRKGMVSLLTRIQGIRIVREFSDSITFQQYAEKQEINFLVISQSLFDLSSAIFLARPGLLEKTLLLKDKPGGETETQNSIYLSEGKDQIILKIRRFTELHSTSDPRGSSGDLTQREKTIVRQVSLGLTNKQIAEALFLSTHTVTTHRKNISSKLGIKSVSGLTVYAIVNNIITIEELSSKPSE